MKKNRLDVKYLDSIIKTTIEAVEKGHEETFRIAEHAKKECERLQKEVEQLKVRISETIQTVDELQKKERASRNKLMVVSREFNKYSEEDIKAAYEHAREIQIKLTVQREREIQLREKRDQMERSLKNMQDILKQAEQLTLQMGVALNFLKGNLLDLSEKLTDINQKQAIAAQIIKAQEEERKFIAREIHDGPAQTMANVLLQVDVCEKLYEKDSDRARKELRDLKELVRNCIREMRKIIFNLRPAALDDLGLEAVTRRYCAEFQEDTGISVDLSIIGDKRRLDSTVEITLFRVIQEALSNVKKHAGAKNVSVKLEFASDVVNLRIEDDGVGFEFEEVKLLSEDSKHFGLVNMRERVDLLKGTIKIKSEPGRGTGIYISIPLSERRNLNVKDFRGSG